MTRQYFTWHKEVVPEKWELKLSSQHTQVRFDPGELVAESCPFRPKVDKMAVAHDAVWVAGKDVVSARVELGGFDQLEGEVIGMVTEDIPSETFDIQLKIF